MTDIDSRGLQLLTLGLDLATEPVSGWIEDEGGQRRAFAGMLELLVLLDAVRESSRPGSSGLAESA